VRGTDLTDEQIQSARKFACARQKIPATDGMIDDTTVVSLKFGDLARLVAWYGAIRYQAGKHGVGGSFEAPGPMEVKS